MTKIAIIGAGFAGLTIAKFLKHKAQITIFEKSLGVGGRMATRYAEKWEFDHGAPFFTATSPEFKAFVEPLLVDRIITKWNARLPDGNLHPKTYNPNLAEKEYFVGTPKMNSIGKYLARDLDIRLETKIIKLEKISGKWKLTDDKSQEYPNFDFVITATPPFQALDILPSNCSYAKDIRKVETLPTFAVMLGLNDNVMQSQKWDVVSLQNSKIEKIIANHNKPYRKIKPSFVVHTSYDWAKENIDMDKNEVGKIIITELENIFNEKINPSITQVHRWLYAKAELHGLAESFFMDKEHGLISCGDWCIGSNFEDAFQSGFDVFNYLNKALT
jgi:renalase